MSTIDAEQAEADFLDLVDDVRQGEDVVITRDGRPVAILTAVEDAAGVPETREPGTAAGKFTIADDFDDPLPDDAFR